MRGWGKDELIYPDSCKNTDQKKGREKWKEKRIKTTGDPYKLKTVLGGSMRDNTLHRIIG